MGITNVDSPEEFEEVLAEKLTKFMENNEPFNVQGSWTGDDGVTVGVLVDYSVEDRDSNYYVGMVSAEYAENPNMDFEELNQSDTFMEAENALIGAVREVFEVPYGRLRGDITGSEKYVNSTFSICHGIWETRESVDYEQTEPV
jgi:hypothetical protein